MPSHAGQIESLPLPSIVLFVDSDRDTLDMYSTYFESSGVWVSTSTIPGEAIEAIEELKPDLVVTDLDFGGTAQGHELVAAVKGSGATRDIPVIVLSGRDAAAPSAETERAADLCLIKPVRPDLLLVQVRRLIVQSQQLRSRGDHARRRADALREKSAQLHARAREADGRLASARRRCPSCSSTLEWVDSASIGGAHYDYYQSCASGCGLYCYDRSGTSWVKLA